MPKGSQEGEVPRTEKEFQFNGPLQSEGHSHDGIDSAGIETATQGTVQNLPITNDTGDPVNAVSIGAGRTATIVSPGTLIANLNGPEGPGGVETGFPGRMTGAVTWFHLFLIFNPETGDVAVVWSQSSASPDLSGAAFDGYTEFAFIGSWADDDTGGSPQLLPGRISGGGAARRFSWIVAPTLPLGPGPFAGPVDLSTPGFIPAPGGTFPTNLIVDLLLTGAPGTANIEDGDVPAPGTGKLSINGSDSVIGDVFAFDTGGQYEIQATLPGGATASLVTRGFQFDQAQLVGGSRPAGPAPS